MDLQNEVKTWYSIGKYKARLVIRGFNQKKWVNYFDTYSHVTKITTIKTLVSLATIHGLIVHHLDVKITLLNGLRGRDLYVSTVRVVQFLVMRTNCVSLANLFIVLSRPLNSDAKFATIVIQHGFVMNTFNSCMYWKVIDSYCVILRLHVDDMLIFGTSTHVVNETTQLFSSHFEMQGMREAAVILGIKIRKSTNGFSSC